MLRSRAVATASVTVLGAALVAVGCSTTPSAATSAPVSADAGGTPATLLGSYTSLPDANGAVTRLAFASDGTYAEATFPCNAAATSTACSDRGTFTVSTALDSLHLQSTLGAGASTFPLQVLDRADDDANNGDDDDDDGGTSSSTSTKDLVTTSGADAGDAGTTLVTPGDNTYPNVQQFVLTSTTNSSRLFTHESPVEDQKQTENCWIYSTTGWADALANYATPTTLHEYSEAYIYYWEIYEQIANSTFQLVSRHASLNQGGFWGRATYLATRYGMMVKGTFTATEEATAAMNATIAINKSLKSGKLKTSAARSNHALIRSELDAAFGLSSSTTSTLNTVFGTAVTKTFQSSATRSTGDPIFRPADIIAELTQGYKDLSVGRLNQAIGVPDPSGNDANTGPFAWSGTLYPQAGGTLVDGDAGGGDGDSGASSRDGLDAGDGADYATRFAMEKRIIAAVNDGLPVPIIWYADMDSYRPDGTFQQASDQSATKGTSSSANGGYHVSLIADYEADSVPGFGTITVGTTRTQAQKDAALMSGTQVRFFRIKNSWGTTGQQSVTNGYNDLYMTYMDGIVHVCDPGNTNCVDQPAFYSLDLPPGY